MEYCEIDFHHYFVEDAIRVTESIINYARLNNKNVECKFITGRGKIQKELIIFLTETYALTPVIPMSNGGVVLVEIY
jgi:hypothetical protein